MSPYYRNPDECPDCGMIPCGCDYAENPCGDDHEYQQNPCPDCGLDDCDCDYEDNPDDGYMHNPCPECDCDPCECYQGNPDDWEDYDDDEDDFDDNPDDEDGYMHNPDDGYMYNPCDDCGGDPCECEGNPDDGYMRNPWNNFGSSQLGDAVGALEHSLQQSANAQTNLSLLLDVAHDLGVLRAALEDGGEQDQALLAQATKAVSDADARLSEAVKNLKIS